MVTAAASPPAFVCPLCEQTFDSHQQTCPRCDSTLVVPLEEQTVYETILPMCGK